MLINYLKERMKSLHNKRLFLFGAYITVIILAIVSTFIDIAIENFTDAIIDILSGVAAFFSYYFLCRKLNNYQISAIILFWIVAVTEFIYIIVHQVDFNIIFTVLIPILAFYTMNKRNIIINLIIYYIVLILLLTYYYFTLESNYLLGNVTYIHSYIVANLYIIVFGIFYYISIDMFINRLISANKTQKILLNELHHRVKNNLNLIASILGLQEYSTQDKEAQNLLEQNRHRIESIAILHEVLYKNNLLEKVDTKPYFSNLITRIISTSTTKKIELISDINNIRLDMSSMLQLGIILNEMLLNTIKHNKSSEIIVEINFKKIDNIYHLIYCDNSKKVDLMKLKQGFGYNIITLSASSFNAKININSNSHLCYDIALHNLGDFIEL